MKKRVVSLICALSMLFTLSTAVCATQRASDYFSATDVRAYAQSGGKVLIEVDVTATHIMQEVGASAVYIYEEQSDGSWDNVYTFTKEDHPYLICTNTAGGYVDAVYQGTAGNRYFASAVFYAKDSSGSEEMIADTNIVTARLIVL